jgi:hypothetical protein
VAPNEPPINPNGDLGTRVRDLRSALFDLNTDVVRQRLPDDASLSDVAAEIQSAANHLGWVEEALTFADRAGPVRWSREARIVVELARTTVPAATSNAEEAERWLRTLRMHGQVGEVLKELGVPEAPLDASAWPPSVMDKRAGETKLKRVEQEAEGLAEERGSHVVTTLDVLFAAMLVYQGTFSRALYARGTSREQLIELLTARLGVRS